MKAATGDKKQDGTLWFQKPAKVLNPLDADAAAEQRNDLAEIAAEEDAPRLAGLLRSASPLSDFIAAVLDLSPFLRDCVKREPAILESLFDQPLEKRLKDIEGQLSALAGNADLTEAALMRSLRTIKRVAHVLIALGDLAGEVDAEITVRHLSDLADGCVRAAIGFLLRQAHEAGKIKLPDPEDPQKGSGWIILGMGKLGAHELNFSSDIDLIVFFKLVRTGDYRPF